MAQEYLIVGIDNKRPHTTVVKAVGTYKGVVDAMIRGGCDVVSVYNFQEPIYVERVDSNSNPA